MNLQICEGVSACNNVKEASNAAEDEEPRVVDEEATAATRIPAACAKLRAAAVGSDARCGRVRDDKKPAGRAAARHKVSPLLGFG